MDLKYYLYDFLGLNYLIFHKINSFTGKYEIYDKFMLFITWLTEPSRFSIYVFLMTGWSMYVIYKLRFNLNKLNDYRYLTMQISIVLMLAHYSDKFLIDWIKEYFHFKMPFCDLPIGYRNIIGNPADSEICDSSFPNDNVRFILIILLSSFELYEKWYQKMIAFFIFILTCQAEIATATAYPADILYALITPVVFVRIYNRIVSYIIQHYIAY